MEYSNRASQYIVRLARWPEIIWKWLNVQWRKACRKLNRKAENASSGMALICMYNNPTKANFQMECYTCVCTIVQTREWLHAWIEVFLINNGRKKRVWNGLKRMKYVYSTIGIVVSLHTMRFNDDLFIWLVRIWYMHLHQILSI